MGTSSTSTTALEVAIGETDLTTEGVAQMHRGGCTPFEIAERVSAQAIHQVGAKAVREWLYENGFPPCTAVYGGRMCERPSTGTGRIARCSTCERS
jgi:hypothetical protein